MTYTPEAARRNPWIRARLFRAFVPAFLDRQPSGSGGKRAREIAAAFDAEYGADFAASSNVSTQLNQLYREGHIRKADAGLYVKPDDTYVYPEDFLAYIVHYARENGESCLKDAVRAFDRDHKRRTKLGATGARRMLDRALRERRLQPVQVKEGTKHPRQWFKHASQ